MLPGGSLPASKLAHEKSPPQVGLGRRDEQQRESADEMPAAPRLACNRDGRSRCLHGDYGISSLAGGGTPRRSHSSKPMSEPAPGGFAGASLPPLSLMCEPTA